MINSLLAPLFALAAPFLAWVIEIPLPYPYVIEEILKALIIYFGWPTSKISSRLIMATLTGICFTLTESILYFLNYLPADTLAPFWLRLAYTVPLHTLTCLVILLPGLTRRRRIFIGLPLAMVIHFLYNSYVPG